MNNITKQTREESFKKLELKKKSKLVYENLEDGEYTARELAKKLFKKRFNKNSRKTRNSSKTYRISWTRISRSSKKEIWWNKWL